MKDTQKILAGFIVGLAAGVAAGILLAPSSGEETRKRLAASAGGIAEELNKKLAGSLGKVSAMAESAVSNGKDYLEELRRKA
jgi:gas vesicle protein